MGLEKGTIIGHGTVTCVVVIPQFSCRSPSQQQVYCMLLDSRSNGDLTFVQSGMKKSIPCKKRIAPQRWRMSNGTFVTDKVGDNLEFIFPEFSESRMVTISPDIFELPKMSPKPAYYLIIGIETMPKLGVVLNFDDLMITIDQQKLPMRTFESISNPKQLRSQFKAFTEPISMQEATNRTVTILDAKYKQANLP